WRPSVSATFHGRDIFAPVAAHLSRGVDPGELGPVTKEWVRPRMTQPRHTADGWAGEVIFVDDFGNLITNIPGEAAGEPGSVRVGGVEVTRWVRTYGEAEAGAAVALVSSAGFVEVAVVQGSAARAFGVGAGAPVVVRSSAS